MSHQATHGDPDRIDDALAELEVFAKDAWSNRDIVERVRAIRQLRFIEKVRNGVCSPQVSEDKERIEVTPDTRWS